MRLGVHVPVSGKIYEAFDWAKQLGCNTMQIFSRNPRQWRHTTLEPEDIAEFKKRRKKTGISPVFIHIPYTINLASPDNSLYKNSIAVYIEDINEAGLLGADYIVTHMGSHKQQGEEWGLKRFAKGLNTILDNTDADVDMLLENTSGSGSWLGYDFSHHQRILSLVKKPHRIGLCLDTCHAYTAGYDLASEEGLKITLEEIDYYVGLENLKLIHLNDSKDKLASRRDRHEDIGKGKIGKAGFRRIVHHPKLKNVPFILETPKQNQADDTRNLKVVRSL